VEKLIDQTIDAMVDLRNAETNINKALTQIEAISITLYAAWRRVGK